VPELARSLIEIIEKERKTNRRFIKAFADFAELARRCINPNLADAAVEEMLIQHRAHSRVLGSRGVNEVAAAVLLRCRLGL
jgi:hypothetical protein